MLTNPPTVVVADDQNISDPLVADLSARGYSVTAETVYNLDYRNLNSRNPVDLIFYQWPGNLDEAKAKATKFRQFLPNLAIIFLCPIIQKGVLRLPENARLPGQTAANSLQGEVAFDSQSPDPWLTQMKEADTNLVAAFPTSSVRAAAWVFFLKGFRVRRETINPWEIPEIIMQTYGEDLLKGLVPL